METSFILVYHFIFFVLWIGIFVHAYRNNLDLPWGFSIVIAGNFALAKFSHIAINIDSKLALLLPVNILLIVSLVGVLSNIGNIREQIFVTKYRKTFLFVLIGFLLGLLLGYFALVIGGKSLYDPDNTSAKFGVFLIVAYSLQVSISEEFLFRGFLFHYLRKTKLNQECMMLFQALLFTLAHVLRYKENWQALCWVFILGILAGYITLKSNNIIPAFVLHVVANLVIAFWVVFVS